MRENGKDYVAAVATASGSDGKCNTAPLADVSIVSGSQTEKHHANLHDPIATKAFDAKQVNANVFAMPSGSDLEFIDASGDAPMFRGRLSIPSAQQPLTEQLTLMAVIDKNGTRERLAALTGLGQWHGAAAISARRDGKIVVFGHRPDDMAVAVNAVFKAEGGLAVTSGAWINALVKQKDLYPAEGKHSETPSEAMHLAQKALDDIVDRKPPLLLDRLMTEHFTNALEPQADTGVRPPFASHQPHKSYWQPPHTV